MAHTRDCNDRAHHTAPSNQCTQKGLCILYRNYRVSVERTVWWSQQGCPKSQWTRWSCYQTNLCMQRVHGVSGNWRGTITTQKVRFLLAHCFSYYTYRREWRAKEIKRTVKELMQLFLTISALKRGYVLCTVIIVFLLKRTVWWGWSALPRVQWTLQIRYETNLCMQWARGVSGDWRSTFVP